MENEKKGKSEEKILTKKERDNKKRQRLRQKEENIINMMDSMSQENDENVDNLRMRNSVTTNKREKNKKDGGNCNPNCSIY